jgi:hypothetical protein
MTLPYSVEAFIAGVAAIGPLGEKIVLEPIFEALSH